MGDRCSIYMFHSISMLYFRAGKIPESLYTAYEENCKKMAAEILEGSCLQF